MKNMLNPYPLLNIVLKGLLKWSPFSNLGIKEKIHIVGPAVPNGFYFYRCTMMHVRSDKNKDVESLQEGIKRVWENFLWAGFNSSSLGHWSGCLRNRFLESIHEDDMLFPTEYISVFYGVQLVKAGDPTAGFFVHAQCKECLDVTSTHIDHLWLRPNRRDLRRISPKNVPITWL